MWCPGANKLVQLRGISSRVTLVFFEDTLLRKNCHVAAGPASGRENFKCGCYTRLQDEKGVNEKAGDFNDPSNERSTYRDLPLKTWNPYVYTNIQLSL